MEESSPDSGTPRTSLALGHHEWNRSPVVAAGTQVGTHLLLYHILPVDAEEEPVLHDLLGITGPPTEPGQRRPSAPVSQSWVWETGFSAGRPEPAAGPPCTAFRDSVPATNHHLAGRGSQGAGRGAHDNLDQVVS